MRASLSVTIAALLALAPSSGLAGTTTGPVDWARYGSQTTVQVISTDADGSRRETTVWMVVVDGRAYVRTGNTHWGDNVASRPAVAVRIGVEEIPVRARLVEDASVRRVVEEAFRAKYGWEDRLLAAVARSEPRIFYLEPRAAAAGPETKR